MSGPPVSPCMHRGQPEKSLAVQALPALYCHSYNVRKWEDIMAWTTPVLVEICVGLEINGYMPADGSVPPEF